MTARRPAAVAVRVALGVAVLAAGVFGAWGLGVAFARPGAGHVERIVVGVPVWAFLALVVAWTGHIAYSIGDAIIDTWRECRR